MSTLLGAKCPIWASFTRQTVLQRPTIAPSQRRQRPMKRAKPLYCLACDKRQTNAYNCIVDLGVSRSNREGGTTGEARKTWPLRPAPQTVNRTTYNSLGTLLCTLAGA